MARITRALQKIFAGSVTPANNIAQFASTITGTPNYTNDPATIQALTEWDTSGLYGSLIQTGGGQNSPVFQELNAMFFLLSRQIAYLNQMGVPEWIATETYYIGQFASNGTGVIYVSQTNGNINNALTDTNNWLPLGTTIRGPGIAKAGCTFQANGSVGTCVINTGFGISSVSKIQLGVYDVNFSPAMPNVFYQFHATPGGNDTSPFSGGNVSIISNSVPTSTAIKTVNQLRIFSYDTASRTLQDPTNIGLTVFAQD